MAELKKCQVEDCSDFGLEMELVQTLSGDILEAKVCNFHSDGYLNES